MSRATTRGLHEGDRIHVRSSRSRKSEKGIVTEIVTVRDGSKWVKYRSELRGGFYMVPLCDVRVIKTAQFKNTEPDWTQATDE